MVQSKICLCLTGSTLEENLKSIERYRRWIDLVELRADFLSRDERLYIRKFPKLANIPTILSIRRKIDGGLYEEGEVTRTVLFARALAFSSNAASKNFAYIDFEEDFLVSSLQDAAMAFGTRIIRSMYNMTGTITNLASHFARLKRTGFEIPKIMCMPKCLGDVTTIFSEVKKLPIEERIICPAGRFGIPSLLLAPQLYSFMTYTDAVPHSVLDNNAAAPFTDPKTLIETYRFRSMDQFTNFYGITGFPLTSSKSSLLHNMHYHSRNLKNVYIPLPSLDIEESLTFAKKIGMKGLTIVSPFKKTVLEHLDEVSPECREIGVCNVVLFDTDRLKGFNTEGAGFIHMLTKFLSVRNLRGMKVSIIGCGGAGHAAAYAVKILKGRACIFNRTIGTAKTLAERYNFAWSGLSDKDEQLMKKYSDLIIQATNVGTDPAFPEADPAPFYHFSGREKVFESIYTPEETAFMTRAMTAGCKVQNGMQMLAFQTKYQLKLFTGY